MRLLLIRHATAVASGTPGIADDDRPLTSAGRRKFREVARGLARVVGRPDVLLSSPLPRAADTARIAAAAWGRLRPTLEPALARGVADIVPLLDDQPEDATVAMVGHEPTLSLLLAHLVGGAEPERVAFRKGGAALLRLTKAGDPAVRLDWFLRPRILRALGRPRRA